jgi:hypothetical protein
MKFRRKPSPLLLLVLPSLAAIATAADIPQGTATKNLPREVAALSPPDTSADLSGVLQGKSSSYNVGTKDAPVDGKDGKPHAGPFVDSQSDRKKTKDVMDGTELVTSKKIILEGKPADTSVHEGVKIPETNDGVMDDPNRVLPKKGTTGLEGGISSQNQDSLGGKLERISGKPILKDPSKADTTKDALKTVKGSNADSKDSGAAVLAGLEVSSFLNHNSRH